MEGLKDKVVVFAGAGGIATATARFLGAAGAKVVVGDVVEAAARRTVHAAGGEGVADIADEGQVKALIDLAVSTYGRIDGLFNVAANIGIEEVARDTNVVDIDLAAWQRTIDVNLTGRSAGFPVTVSPNMDAWLKSHEVFVTATGNATYSAGDDAHRLAHDPALLRLCIRAIREGYAIIDALGLPVSPGWFRLWQKLPLPVIAAMFGRFLDSTAWDPGTEQLVSMRDEVEMITDEIRQLAATAGVAAVAIEELVRRRDLTRGT